MNNTFTTKFLLHLNQKKQETGEQGFTLIELLVVIIIIGILAAIALPSFLNQAAKARQSEAKTYVGSLVRTQQAHRLENPNFATSIDQLSVGLKSQTKFYKYEVPNAASGYATAAIATSLDTALKGYLGAVQQVQKSGAPDASSQGLVCEAKTAGTTAPTPTSWVTNYNSGGVATNDIECNSASANPVGG